MIGGNKVLNLFLKSSDTSNSLGEQIPIWTDYKKIKGWLDYQGGIANREWDAKIEDSTHVFISDYQDIVMDENLLKGYIDGQEYEVQKVDNPMELNRQLEIYLKKVGDNSEF